MSEDQRDNFRRQDYESAIRETMGIAGYVTDVSKQAEAAMEVADGELKDVMDENAKLREELSEFRGMKERRSRG